MSTSTTNDGVPYAPYKSHRRAQSLVTVAATSPSAEPSPSTSGRTTPTIVKNGHQRAKISITGLQIDSNLVAGAPASASASTVPPPLRRTTNPSTKHTSLAPPPLRSASSLRPSASSRLKGKGRASLPQPRSPGERPAPPERSASGRFLGQEGDSTPPQQQQQQQGTSATQRTSNGSNGSSNTSISNGSVRVVHRPTRSTNSTPLPHHISTAARLRGEGGSSASLPSSSGGTTPTPASPLLAATALLNLPIPGPGAGGLGPSLQPSAAAASPLAPLALQMHKTPYRPGFQPRGMVRNRTDEFERSRATRAEVAAREEKALQGERMERRLEKLVSIHFGGATAAQTEQATTRSLLASWTGSLRGARAEQERRVREREMEIVRWESDALRKTCAICSTPFSLAVRKHHCRLCGRVVCASPHLSLPAGLPLPLTSASTGKETPTPDAKCSGLIVADPASGIIQDAPPREALGAGERAGVRICRQCKDVVVRRQYMLSDGHIPTYVKLYEALVRLQKEIEQTLPEFQEMVLGLQKHDAVAALGTSTTDTETSTAVGQTPNSRVALALQRDAARARKGLLANFANYDALAKKIRGLPVEGIGGEAGGDKAQQRLQEAIWTRANMFLQQNMFPLHSLPKLGAAATRKEKSKLSNEATASHQRTSSTISTNNVDPALLGPDAEEDLAVLEQQLRLVSGWADAAQAARKLDDAKSLRASRDEVAREVSRRRAALKAAGRGT